MTRQESDGLKVFFAFCVFFCHCFDQVNWFGFFFVSVFFFVSGYGLYGRSQSCIVPRIPRLMALYSIAVCVYSVAAGRFMWDIPVCWYLLIYAVQLIAYRLSPRWFDVLVIDLLLSVAFWSLGMNYPWWASMSAFPVGLLVRQAGYFPRWHIFALMVPLSILLSLYSRMFSVFVWAVLYPWLYLVWVHRGRFVVLSRFVGLTMPFYLYHFLFCGFFGLQGGFLWSVHIPIPVAVVLSFVCSLIFAYVMSRFLETLGYGQDVKFCLQKFT